MSFQRYDSPAAMQELLELPTIARAPDTFSRGKSGIAHLKILSPDVRVWITSSAWVVVERRIEYLGREHWELVERHRIPAWLLYQEAV